MDVNASAGETRLLIDAQHLTTNLRTMRRGVAADVKMCAVLKADAYGHGAAIVAQHLLDIESVEPFLKVDQFAVATFDEAYALREFTKPIMLLRPIENVFLGRQRELIEHALQMGWTLTLASAAAADDVARIALHAQKRAHVQIMIDTGMTRCGTPLDQFDHVLERTLSHASLRLSGISTHFVSSEVAGDPFTTRQLRQFSAVLDKFPLLEGVPRHAANSGAIFFMPRAHFDVVRAGISLYGVDPTCRPSVDRPLAPIGRWTAPIIAIHEIDAGQTVGYGQSWVAPSRTRVAVLPVGYADGYPRGAGNRAVMKHGQTVCGVIGKVSMDMTTIDVTRVSDVAIGDEVTVMDGDPLSPASVYNLARAVDTIPYEIFTRIGARVKRVGINSPVSVEEEEESVE